MSSNSLPLLYPEILLLHLRPAKASPEPDRKVTADLFS
jgi:hypothetical protein